MDGAEYTIFENKYLHWFDHFESATLKASSWCTLSSLCMVFFARYLFKLGLFYFSYVTVHSISSLVCCFSFISLPRGVCIF